MKCTALTIFPDALHEVIIGALKESDDVLVQRVHVLDQPLGAVVGHRAGIVNNSEVRVGSEFWFFKLGMVAMLGNELFREGLVGGLREPAFLIQEGQDPQRLQQGYYITSLVSYTMSQYITALTTTS